jgi:hypothetical protein
MYLSTGQRSAVASWQAAFSNTSERTLVVDGKNPGVASAPRAAAGPQVVAPWIAIALNNVEKSREGAGHDVSSRAHRTLPTATLPTVSVPPRPPAPPVVAMPAPTCAAARDEHEHERQPELISSISPNATMSATRTRTRARCPRR